MEFTKEQQQAFLNLAYILMTVDGNLNSQERDLLKTYESKTELRAEAGDSDQLTDAALKCFGRTDIAVRKQLYKVLEKAARIDYGARGYNTAEKQWMKNLANSLLISESEQTRLDASVNQETYARFVGDKVETGDDKKLTEKTEDCESVIVAELKKQTNLLEQLVKLATEKGTESAQPSIINKDQTDYIRRLEEKVAVLTDQNEILLNPICIIIDFIKFPFIS